MPTMGALSAWPPREPKKPASPKSKMPPSEATSQYPPPSGLAAMPTIGALSGVPPMEPKKPAFPKSKMPPSDATIQYPPAGSAAPPTTGRCSDTSKVSP